MLASFRSMEVQTMRNLHLALAACVLFSLSSLGCSGEVVVRTAPPPEREEVVAVAPSPQHFWVRGHWAWNGGGYNWVPGHWEIRRPTAVWQPGRWRESGGGWVWVEGRWVER